MRALRSCIGDEMTLIAETTLMPNKDLTCVIVAPIGRELLDSIDDPEAFKSYLGRCLTDALERELFDGLTLAEYEDRLLDGTGEGVPLGIITARLK